MGTYVNVKELPPVVRRALEAVEYGRRDIEVIPRETVTLGAGAGGAGRRGFSCLIDLEAGTYRVIHGSWGGAGLGSRGLQGMVDLDQTPRDLRPGLLLLQGSMGYGPTWAQIQAHPTMIPKMLPAADGPELEARHHQALYCFACIKGGEYRREEMRRRRVSAETVEELVAMGLLKRNAAGATAITTAGRNARDTSIR